MKRYTWFLVFLLVLLPGWASGADTYYISPTGDNTTGTGAIGAPWKTVKKGLASLAASDTLILRGGTYSSADDIYESCTTAGVTIQAYTGETPIIQGPTDNGTPSTINYTLLYVNADNVTIDGLTFTLSEGAGIDVKDCSNARITNCTVNYTYKSCINFTGTGGSHILENSDLSYSHRWRYYDPGTGVGGPLANITTPYSIIRNNVFHHSTAEGLDIIYNKNTGSLVEDNVIYGCKKIHLYLSSSRNCIVRRNLIYSITDWEGDGIWVGGENFAEGTGSDDGHMIYDNMIANTEVALAVQGESECSINGLYIYNNTIINSTGSAAIRFWPLNLTATIANVYFTNNIIVQPTGTTAMIVESLSSSAFVGKGYNLWSQASTNVPADIRGTGDIYSGNPNFTNAPADWNDLNAEDLTAANFAIGLGSCVNAGVAPTTCTAKNDETDQLTVGTTRFWLAGDTVWDDDTYSATVDSIDSTTKMTISGTNKAQITAAPDGLFFRQIADSAIDIGADEYEGTPIDDPPAISTFTVTPSTVANLGDITWAVTATDTDAMTYLIAINGTTIASGTLTTAVEATDTYTLPAAYNSSSITVSCTVCDSNECAPTQNRTVVVGTQATTTYTFGENSTDDYTSVFTDTSVSEWTPDQHNWGETYQGILARSLTTGDWEIFFKIDFSTLAAETISDTEIIVALLTQPTSDCTLTLYSVTDDFDVNNATWNCAKDDAEDGSCDTAWTGTRGHNTELATITVNAADDVGATYSFNSSALDTYISSVKATTGRFCIVNNNNTLPYFYSSNHSTDGRRPRASITIGEGASESGTIGTWSMVTPGSGSTVKAGDTIIIASSSDTNITFTDAGGNPTVLVTDGSHETTMTLVGTTATAYNFQWTGTVAAASTGALSVKANSLSDGDGAFTYVHDPAALTLTHAAQALGITADSTAPASITTTEVCDADGTPVEADETITSDATIAYFALNFPEGSWFVDGSLSALPIICEGPTYGTVTLYYAGTQPTGWGVGTSDWLYAYDVEDGARGTAALPAAIVPVGGAKIIDPAGNELASYNLNNSYKWIIADPRDWLLPDDFATLTAWKAGVTNEVPDDSVDCSDITEPDAVDLSGFDGTDGYPITYTGTKLTVPSTGLTVGDWSVIDIREIIGNLTTGTNAVVSNLVIDGDLTASGTITRVMVK